MENTTKAVYPEVPVLKMNVSKNERYRCFSKNSSQKFYKLTKDIRIISLKEPPLRLELRLKRTVPRRLYITWNVNWIKEDMDSQNVLIHIKQGDSEPLLLKKTHENGTIAHEIGTSKIVAAVTATAYFNEYLNTTIEKGIFERDVSVKNLTYKRDKNQVHLKWNVDGSFPYEECRYVL
ncbi:hypothetical protein GCK32_017383, partial [Trichostrongylus colubriformis]